MNVHTYFCDINNHWGLCLGLFLFFFFFLQGGCLHNGYTQIFFFNYLEYLREKLLPLHQLFGPSIGAVCAAKAG